MFFFHLKTISKKTQSLHEERLFQKRVTRTYYNIFTGLIQI